jgi:hypothetical protein
MVGVPPGTRVIFHGPVAGLPEVKIPVPLLITHNAVDAHDTPPRRYGQDRYYTPERPAW